MGGGPNPSFVPLFYVGLNAAGHSYQTQRLEGCWYRQSGLLGGGEGRADQQLLLQQGFLRNCDL